MRHALSTRLTALATTAALLGGLACATAEGGTSKTAIGAVGGAVAGGILGEVIGGHGGDIVAGAVVGGLVGAFAGNILDQRDRQIANETAQRSLETTPSGHSSGWQNPDTGNSGSFTPTRTYQQADGTYCREFTQEIVVAGKREQAFGTACRQADGTWKIVG
jgi:surface antigen